MLIILAAIILLIATWAVILVAIPIIAIFLFAMWYCCGYRFAR